MTIAYRAITILLALMVFWSGYAKIRRDPHVVRVVHETVGVPLKYFAVLASCEFAGGIGVLLGMLWQALGLAASACLILYFLAAAVSHLRVQDLKGIGPATFLLALSAASFALRGLH